MKRRDLSASDKYLLLGRLLKKCDSAPVAARALDVVRGGDTLEGKLDALIEICRTADSFPPEGCSPETGESRERQCISGRNPRIVVLDPRSEMTRILTGSHLSRLYTFIHVREPSPNRPTGEQAGESDRLAASVLRLNPSAVIINSDSGIDACLKRGRSIRGRRSRTAVLILCARSKLGSFRVDPEEARLLSKPLNLMRLSDILAEMLD